MRELIDLIANHTELTDDVKLRLIGIALILQSMQEHVEAMEHKYQGK